jgi:hypothetical protein
LFRAAADMIGARCTFKNPSGMTTRPPPGSRPRAMIAVSISTSLRTGAMIGVSLSDRAAASNDGLSRYGSGVGIEHDGCPAFRPGAISDSNSSHLPPSVVSKAAKPVMFPYRIPRPMSADLSA